jgi:hypothetical protein
MNTIYISLFMLKVFNIRNLMQSVDVNTFDDDNQLYLIFYLHQCFITSDKIRCKIYCYFHLFPEANISFLQMYY